MAGAAQLLAHFPSLLLPSWRNQLRVIDHDLDRQWMPKEPRGANPTSGFGLSHSLSSVGKRPLLGHGIPALFTFVMLPVLITVLSSAFVAALLGTQDCRDVHKDTFRLTASCSGERGYSQGDLVGCRAEIPDSVTRLLHVRAVDVPRSRKQSVFDQMFASWMTRLNICTRYSSAILRDLSQIRRAQPKRSLHATTPNQKIDSKRAPSLRRNERYKGIWSKVATKAFPPNSEPFSDHSVQLQIEELRSRDPRIIRDFTHIYAQVIDARNVPRAILLTILSFKAFSTVDRWQSDSLNVFEKHRHGK
ncbi:hypothetical protein ANO11243_052710 [Dothideomycetidae sp. 11243]|nr:hypothetical protein ANO11243_052710 [fungal sp. No.11243]